MLATVAFSKLPSSADAPRSWTYFSSHREWCDHLVFFEDGTLARGRAADHGTWQLRWNGDHRLVLELQWAGPSNSSEEFESPDGTASRFSAAGASLECVEEESLPLPDQGVGRSLGGRGLVFSSVGSQCLPVVRDHWLRAPSSMDFDVALMYYKEAGSRVFNDLSAVVEAQPGVELQHSPGMKWPNFLRWVELQGGFAVVASRYDYIWVVDDDVRLETTEINRLFSILREHDQIQFACPSFAAGSDGVWRYFDGHDPRYRLRYTDFVECTAPVLKASMLLDPMFQRCLRAVRTGCFIDFCFFPAAGAREDAVAIIDAVQCHHPPRGPDTPSQMRQVKAWEDHKEDDVYFEQAGVPRTWYWFRQPQVFGGLPADLNPRGGLP